MRGSVVLLAIAALAGCSADDVVVADVTPPAASIGPPGPGGPACRDQPDCAPNAFCAKHGCGDPIGHCELRPLTCDEALAPSCGCDGVTYWSDCLRRQHGVPASTGGECTVGVPCGPGAPCPMGASCARLVFPDATCDPSAPGACWAVPSVCPPSSTPDRWTSCDGVVACRSTCEAIAEEAPFRLAPPGSCP